MESTEIDHNFDETLPQTPPKPPQGKGLWLWLLLGLILVTGTGAAVWYFVSSQNQAPTATAPPPGVKVKLSTVETARVEDSSDYIASLESRRSVTLQPRIQGQISKIYVKSGDTVNQGDTIIQVDSREQQASVGSVNAAADAARSQLANAQATLKSLEAERLSNLADVRLNQQEYQRYASLAEEGAVSRQTRDQYANRLATAKASLEATESRIQAQKASISQAQNALQQAQANINEQQVQLQYYKITAPFGGTVGDIPVKEGDFVNTSTQLATITQNQPLEVEINVPIEKSSQLRQGMLVELLDQQNQIMGTSRVFFIAPSVSNNTQSVLVKSLFNNTQGKLRADQQIKARVIWEQSQGVTIPVTAVSRVAGESFVFVAENQTSPQGKSQIIAKQKRVKLGSIKGNNYQVLDGLKPGEKIVTSGLLNLRDGVPIIPE